MGVKLAVGSIGCDIQITTSHVSDYWLYLIAWNTSVYFSGRLEPGFPSIIFIIFVKLNYMFANCAPSFGYPLKTYINLWLHDEFDKRLIYALF